MNMNRRNRTYILEISGIAFRIFRNSIFLFLVLAIYISLECEAGKRYKIVIMPFKDHSHLDLAEMVPDVLRSTIAQTEYFEPVDRGKTYETIVKILPSGYIYIDNTKRVEGEFTSDQIDLMARLDMRKVQKFSKRLKADYTIRGSISQIGQIVRIDAEIVEVKSRKSLSFFSVEGSEEELLSENIKELSNKITSFCRSLNAYDDALGVLSIHNQGRYTFDVAERKLKELLPITKYGVGIHAVLMSLYISNNKIDNPLNEKIVKEGEEILELLNNNFDVKVLEVFQTSGLDPFGEIARIYKIRGNNDKAIEIYQKAISVYPMHNASYYKELGTLYIEDGFEDKAISAFKRSLVVDKSSLELYFLLASIFESRGMIDKAREQLNEALKYASNVNDINTVKEKIDQLTSQ